MDATERRYKASYTDTLWYKVSHFGLSKLPKFLYKNQSQESFSCFNEEMSSASSSSLLFISF